MAAVAASAEARVRIEKKVAVVATEPVAASAAERSSARSESVAIEPVAA